MKSNFLKIWVCTFFFVEGIVSAWGAGHVAFSPLRGAFCLDNGAVRTLDARQGFKDEFREYTPENLRKSPNLKPLPPRNRTLKLINGNGFCRNEVFDNLRWLTAEFKVDQPGLHTFKVYMVDPEIVLEQLVFNPDNTHPSYFGAPPVRHQ